ncbi:MAG: glycerol-3-phosphate acyltransferase [Sulfurovum sp. AS07-7]|nr:MAG: glycerol-3-phosphate acyltransferase [Sulfurovum sp. AS07-7]KIM05985.1 MAG: glycerol-3-phosphate acyltransferase [Sulfurovum sp. AS07-7]
MDLMSNQNVLFYLASYIIAGIPFGFILAKLIAGVDVREEGSGNIGATNVLRVLKQKAPHLATKLSILTLLLDTLKGLVILLIANAMGLSDSVLWLIAILSVLGHCFSPFLMFEGGKGVATGLGVMGFMLPFETLIGVVVWLFFAKVLKIVSLASIIGVLALLVSSYILHPDVPNIHTHAPIWIISWLIIYKHIPNIVRLFKKEESKVA